MIIKSAIKPPGCGYLIEQTGLGRCNIHFYENVTEEDGQYSCDWYVTEGVIFHDNLKKNIKANKKAWLNAAKESENAEPKYTETQRLQQDITDLMLENIEQGQQITDLELILITGGNE